MTRATRGFLLALAAVLLVQAATVAWILATGVGFASHRWDEVGYHLPVVRTMSAELPMPNLRDYDAATGPGYHLVMAVVHRVVGEGDGAWRLKIASIGFAALLTIVVASVAARWTRDRRAAFLAAPLAWSPFVIASASHVHTDNFGWLFALGAVAITLVLFDAAKRRRPPASGLVFAGVVATAAVAVRQIFIWTIAPIAFVALALSPARALLPAPLRAAFEIDRRTNDVERGGRRRLAAGAVGVALPILALASFVALWGGLVPPNFREFHASHVSTWTLGVALAIVGTYAPFFLLLVARELPSLVTERGVWRWTLLSGAVLAFVASVAFPTSTSVEMGRNGGPIWELVSRFPVVADRSVVLPLLAIAGAWFLVLGAYAARRAGHGGTALLLLATMLGAFCAQTMNSQSFQRYYDTPILAMLAWLAAMAQPPGERTPRVAMAGPVGLAVLLLGLVFVRLSQAN